MHEDAAARAGIAGDFFGRRLRGFARHELAQRRAPARAFQLPWRADAVAAPFPHCVLHYSVFSRVVRDHCQHAFGLDVVAQHRQRALQRRELVVHGNPKTLEDPREIRRTGSRSERSANGSHEIVTPFEWHCSPTPDDLARKTAGANLVGVVAQHGYQLALFECVEQIGGGHSGGRIHAHVQWRPFAKRKPARRFVNLMRRNAKVGENAIEFLSLVREQPVCLCEVAQYNAKSARRLFGCEPFARRGYRIRVSVHRGDIRPD